MTVKTKPPSRALDPLDANTNAALLLGLTPVEPKPRMRARILAHVLDHAALIVLNSTVTIDAADAAWQAFAPGIERKVMFEQAGTFAFLLRLKAGAVIPAHGHSSHEECLVLDGEVEIDGRVVQKGGFHFAPQGVQHTPIRARTAALLYLRTSASPTTN